MAIFHMNRFHFMAALTWQFTIFFATQMIFPIFSSYVPRWRCTDSAFKSPDSHNFAKNCTLFEECRVSIEFEYEYFYSTALEFDWICGPSSYLVALYSQVQFFGVLMGTITFGSLSDLLGRKPVSIIVLSFGITCIIISGMVSNWQLLLAARFFIGVSIGGSIVVVCTFVMEMLLPEQRMALRAFFNWGMSRLLMTGICYIFPNWRSATFVCAACALPGLLIIIFIFPESPTWLHSKKKIEKMRKSEKWIAKMANVQYVEVEHAEIPPKTQTRFDMLRDKELVRRVSVLWLMWFTASICGYATDLNSSNIVGNLFLNQTLFSILIASSKILLVAYDTYQSNFSRRNLHQYSQLIVIICFLILTVLVYFFNEHGVSILIVNLIGTIFIEYTWDACYLCAVESVPTEMRATSLGFCSLMARIGAILAPTLTFLNTIWPSSAYLTVVLLGTLNLLVSYKFLIETKGVNLDKVELIKLLEMQTMDNEENRVEEREKMIPQSSEKL